MYIIELIKSGVKTMPEIDGINPVKTYSREYLTQSNNRDKSVQNEKQNVVKGNKNIKTNNYIYEDPRKKKAKAQSKEGIDLSTSKSHTDRKTGKKLSRLE